MVAMRETVGLMPESCDLLVFAAHPDDAELCAGGLLAKTAARGGRTAVVDLTRGELGSLGTPEVRAEEAAAAASVLGLTTRLNLGFADGGVADTDENRRKIVQVVRELRPAVIVGPPLEDHHPDHTATAELLRGSFYLCGIRKYLPELPPHKPRALLHHFASRAMRPDLVVDITPVFEQRMEAVRCYGSQFGAKQDGEFALRIASEGFLDSIEATLKYFGSLIGVPYGEPFTSATPVPVDDLVGLYGSEPWKDG